MLSSHKSSMAQRTIGHIAPKLAELTEEALFGDIWERKELSPRGRSMITASALVTGGNTEQLGFHLSRASDNGLTEEELIEVITHLTVYIGWPKAMSAVTVAQDLFTYETRNEKEDSDCRAQRTL